jgi:hypothetical protein
LKIDNRSSCSSRLQVVVAFIIGCRGTCSHSS